MTNPSPSVHQADPPRLRILLLNTAHKWVGEAAVTDLLASTLQQNGHRVLVVTPDEGPVQERLSDASYDIQRVPWKGMGEGPSKVARQYRAIARVLRAFQPHIIQVGRGKEHWCVAFLRPLFAGRARICRTRHVVLPMRQKLVNRWLFRYATDALTAVSAPAMQSLGRLGSHLPEARRRIIRGAVDTTRYSPAQRSDRLRGELGCGPSDALIGCLGRLQRIKGYDVFLRAMSTVSQRHPNVRFVLAGRKVDLANARLARLHRESGLQDRIRYLGFLDRPEELIASLDLGVIASRGSEGFSRICIEYFASGVPVVATRVGALPEIIRDGETGLLVPPEDPEAMANAVCRYLENPGFRGQLSRQAMAETDPLYTPERLAREMEEVYRASLQEGFALQ